MRTLKLTNEAIKDKKVISFPTLTINLGKMTFKNDERILSSKIDQKIKITKQSNQLQEESNQYRSLIDMFEILNQLIPSANTRPCIKHICCELYRYLISKSLDLKLLNYCLLLFSFLVFEAKIQPEVRSINGLVATFIITIQFYGDMNIIVRNFANKLEMDGKLISKLQVLIFRNIIRYNFLQKLELLKKVINKF